MAEKKNQAPVETDPMIDNLVENAQKALEAFMNMKQEQVDEIVHAMALAGLDNHQIPGQDGGGGDRPRRVTRTRSSKTSSPPNTSGTPSNIRRPSASWTKTSWRAMWK